MNKQDTSYSAQRGDAGTRGDHIWFGRPCDFNRGNKGDVGLVLLEFVSTNRGDIELEFEPVVYFPSFQGMDEGTRVEVGYDT